MNLLGIGSIIESVGKIADDLVTTDKEKMQLALQEKAMDISLVQEQVQVNKAEAQHQSLFVAGWRPFIGWVGGLALAYQFLLYPLLGWIWALLHAQPVIPCHLAPTDVQSMLNAAGTAAESTGTLIKAIDLGACTFNPPPAFESDVLFTIVTGMLGIGGMRSYDKLKGTNTAQVGEKLK